MKPKHAIIAMSLMGLIVSATSVPAGRFIFPDTPAQRNPGTPAAEFNQPALLLAENDQNNTGDQSRPPDSQNERTPASGTDSKENGPQKSDAAATESLKPFEPSEEIAAEQAVDFPVDI